MKSESGFSLAMTSQPFLKTKVSNCGTSGCKKEQLTPQEVEKVMTDNFAGDAYPSISWHFSLYASACILYF